MNTPRPDDIRRRLLVVRLPSPPQTLIKLLTLCQSDDVGMSELSELVANDPAITARVLTVAHSAAYQRADAQPLSLLQSTSRLGTALIKVLVISESVSQTFSAFRQTGGADLRDFWKHSLSVALIARELARRLDGASTEDAYLAGLLHDVGRLALLAAAPEHYPALFGALDDGSLCAQEQRSLDIDHTEAGAWLLERWHLSEQMIESVRCHHEDASRLAAAQPLTRILHLSHRLAALPLNDPQAVTDFVCAEGLTADDLSAILKKAALQVEHIARDLGIDISVAKIRPTETDAAAKPVDAVQAQLAQDVLERSVLNEMAMTLISQGSTQAALTSLRQHASALLHLEAAVVMVMRDKQQTLVPVSMGESHRAAAQLQFEVAAHAAIAQCISTRKVVFAGRDSSLARLLDAMAVDEIVLLPLLTTQHCLGLLVAAVPAELSQHLKSQTAMMQTFGVYAGLALSRRQQADKSRSTQMALQKQEQQAALKNLVHEVGRLVEKFVASEQIQPGGPVDLCLVVRDMVQLLQNGQSIPASIEISCEIAERVSLVQGSPGAIRQIVLIMLKNACEAMPDGGQIQLNAGVLVHRGGTMFIALTVSDAGPGSTQEIQAQLFQPLQGRRAGDRQGLGLNVVQHLVEKMAGHLNFKTGPGGTRFDILLPCARSPGAGPAGSASRS